MIRTASRNDLPALRALFARANDAPYPLEIVAEEKCFGNGVAGAPVVRVYGDFEGVAVTCGKWLRILIVDRNARRRGIGSALLADSRPRVIAAEPGNYFIPGVFDEGSMAFFRACGYLERAETWNLHCVATGFSPPEIRRAEARRYTQALEFIEREFGRIWRFEAARAPQNILFAEENGAIVGFATYEANNRGLGTFGPTGVAGSMRGRGIGRALLLASLAELGRLGYARTVIPWTDAIDFYRRSCGAEPAHRFTTFALDSAP